MLQVLCQRCGWNFKPTRDTTGWAVAEIEQSRAEYFQFNCPKCRHAVKVQATDLRRHLPADYVLPELPPKPAPVSVAKEEAKPAEPPAAESEPAEPPPPPSIEEPKPVAKKPTAGKPAAAKSTEKKPVVKKESAAKKPTAKKPATKKPAVKKPATEKPARKS